MKVRGINPAQGANACDQLWTVLHRRPFEILGGTMDTTGGEGATVWQHHFNEIRRGLPRMSATLLAQRLKKKA